MPRDAVAGSKSAPVRLWHLRFVLQAIGRQAHGDPTGIGWDRGGLGPKAVGAAAMSRRAPYGRRRVSETPPPLAAVAPDSPPTRFRFRKFLSASVAVDPDAALPGGITVDGFHDLSLHQGAFQEPSDGSVQCPIPGLSSFPATQCRCAETLSGAGFR